MNDTTLAPVRGRARIDVLDVLRGLAILGIFYMNIPGMAQNVWIADTDVRTIGWTGLDRWTWIAMRTLLDGTQRGVLELLFGAGMMVLTARAMRPDGPVAVADLYYRRNLWLLAFGLADIFAMLWFGDILSIYALAALFLFPFRLLKPRWLVVLGLGFTAYVAVTGAQRFIARAELLRAHAVMTQKVADGTPLTAADRKARDDWRKVIEQRTITPDIRKQADAEARAHHGSLADYATSRWALWHSIIIGEGVLWFQIAEAFCVMLLGIALWKWGVIQGDRSRRFYLALLLVCYAFGFGTRFYHALQYVAFRPLLMPGWITMEAARIAVSIGHVALVNWVMQSAVGRRLLAPFKAAGRTAFSLYFLTSIIGLWVLFAPWGLLPWARLSWAEMFGVATLVNVVLLLVANLWVRRFASGPLEWAWRSLAYLERQPFRHPRDPEPLPGPNALSV